MKTPEKVEKVHFGQIGPPPYIKSRACSDSMKSAFIVNPVQIDDVGRYIHSTTGGNQFLAHEESRNFP